MDARQDNFYKIILFRMAVFWKLKYLGYYGRGGLGLGLRLGLGLGLGIHKFTEGYLYFRNDRYPGYAILRDTHISVTPVQSIVRENQCNFPSNVMPKVLT